jgi:hypothetical protein
MYEQMQSLFAFLKVFNNPTKHWKDYIGWEIVESLDHVVLIATKQFWLRVTFNFLQMK